MGETKEYLVDEIEGARDALDRDLNALDKRVREQTNIRLQLERRPWIIAAGVIGLGVLLGLIVASFGRD